MSSIPNDLGKCRSADATVSTAQSLDCVRSNFLRLTGCIARLRRAGNGRWAWECVIGLAIGLLFCAGANAGEATASEAQVKAAFLLNFPKYVEWPSSAFGGTNSPIVVVILGDERLKAEFGKISEGKSFNGRSIEFRGIEAVEELSGPCHIFFIGAREQKSVSTVIAEFGDKSVLTVGEQEDFLDQGGVINLKRRADRRIRLEVNLTAARRAGLRISSKLLGVADVLKGEKQEKQR